MDAYFSLFQDRMKLGEASKNSYYLASSSDHCQIQLKTWEVLFLEEAGQIVHFHVHTSRNKAYLVTFLVLLIHQIHLETSSLPLFYLLLLKCHRAASQMNKHQLADCK